MDFWGLNNLVDCVSKSPKHEYEVSEEFELLIVNTEAQVIGNILYLTHVIFVNLSNIRMI